MDEIAVVARLLPVIAEDMDASKLLDRDLRLSGPVRTHQARVLSRRQTPFREDNLMSWRDSHHEIRGERRFPALRDLGPELDGGRLGAVEIDVPERHPPTTGQKRSRSGAAVDPGADH
jgi:hypothetical protein